MLGNSVDRLWKLSLKSSVSLENHVKADLFRLSTNNIQYHATFFLVVTCCSSHTYVERNHVITRIGKMGLLAYMYDKLRCLWFFLWRGSSMLWRGHILSWEPNSSSDGSMMRYHVLCSREHWFVRLFHDWLELSWLLDLHDCFSVRFVFLQFWILHPWK